MKKNRTLGILALLFIIAGAILTLENYHVIPGISINWPVLLLILGMGFVLLFFERKKEPIIWIGSFLLFISIFFYYLNFTSWKSLAHLWPVFLGVIGLSFLATAIFTRKRIFAYLAILFITIFLALYLVFTISLKLWPMSLFIFGISLLIIDYFNKKRGKK